MSLLLRDHTREQAWVIQCNPFQNWKVKLDTRRQALYASACAVTVPAYVIPPWPWSLTFWPQNLMHSSLSHNALSMYVWWKRVKYPQDIVLTMFWDAYADRWMDARLNRTKTVWLRPHYVRRMHKNFLTHFTGFARAEFPLSFFKAKSFRPDHGMNWCHTKLVTS